VQAAPPGPALPPDGLECRQRRPEPAGAARGADDDVDRHEGEDEQQHEQQAATGDVVGVAQRHAGRIGRDQRGEHGHERDARSGDQRAAQRCIHLGRCGHGRGYRARPDGQHPGVLADPRRGAFIYLRHGVLELFTQSGWISLGMEKKSVV
jgi:hypothetical protein